MDVYEPLKNKPAILMLVFRIAITLLVLYEILMQPHLSTEAQAAYIAGILLIQLNDYFRIRLYLFFRNNRMLYFGSMAASIAGIGLYMVQFDSLATDVYFVFPVIEMFLYSSKIQPGLLAFHMAVFLYTLIQLKADVTHSLFAYLAMLLLAYLFRSNSLQKKKGEALNIELSEANAKLKEITIAQERTRIAQELHDSIGHGLVSLKMHLEYAGNVADVNPQKTKEVITKALAISQASIDDLRKAVAVLKSSALNERMELQKSLNQMINSIQVKGRLAFTFDFDDAVEVATPDIKHAIYSTVREAVTNGLKHGKARTFYIEIKKCRSIIQVVVHNDGEACNHLQKSHGIRGIEERIYSLEGTVQFSSDHDRSFAVTAEIPYVAAKELV
ncbi:sensor histidine kinase [Paenibacillus ihuae]|uniref:sensor histidine kinase n=1 Tax=Paenibacillus ihuae TaxID=1232431 RepID=UPI0006D5A446|nr:histidine kinase [Paenibacillus ihuae]